MLGAMRKRLIAEGFEHDQVWELCHAFFLEMIAPTDCDCEPEE